MILINSMAKISKIVFSSLRKGIFLSLESFADEIPETELFSRPDLGGVVSLCQDMGPYRHGFIGSKIVCRPTILEDLKYSGYCGDCLWSDSLCPRHSRERLTNFAVATFLIFSIFLGIFTVLSCCEVI